MRSWGAFELSLISFGKSTLNDTSYYELCNVFRNLEKLLPNSFTSRHCCDGATLVLWVNLFIYTEVIHQNETFRDPLLCLKWKQNLKFTTFACLLTKGTFSALQFSLQSFLYINNNWFECSTICRPMRKRKHCSRKIDK